MELGTVVPMPCPRCGSQMTYGAPHSEACVAQKECHVCGYIEPVYGAQTLEAVSPVCFHCGKRMALGAVIRLIKVRGLGEVPVHDHWEECRYADA